ncbi:uncharacterized protein LOC127079045 [Lathyrus oleraceus]|uniref:uncharacterized protein LOC127079045 n=1 Tax=Pisum sativum TaxID=3888 RepID=UPI0021D09183|nr:uncharacterized protein LOC127079045 [Pisum sativum]
MGMGQKIKPKYLAMTLGISPEDLLSHYKEDRDAQGLRRGYLEEVSRRMAEAERWGSYIDVVALIMFGIILFPNVSDFMYVSAVNIFWVVKNLEIDPVPALLTDVYYTMSICHSREKRSLRCCIPLLYQWFASHLYRDIRLIKTKGNHGWAQKLAPLNEGSILMYPKKIDPENIIINCGSFPNVPLIGSKGCINYYHVLALRQLGHPIWEWPKEAEIEEFILHGGEASYIELLRKVTWACEKVHVKDNKPKSKDTSSEESYTPWIKERVRLVKLHFIIDPAYVPDMPNLITVSTKEVDRLKSNIARLEQYKESLEHNIYDATYEKTQISYDLEQKDKQLLENMEELWTERSKRKRLWEVYSVSELTLKISMVS